MTRSEAAPWPRRAWDRGVVLSRRWGVGRLLIVAAGALLAGVLLGQWLAPAPQAASRGVVERELLPLHLDADEVWTGTDDDEPGVVEGLNRIREQGSDEQVRGWAQQWLSAYDTVLLRMAGLELPVEARPIQRQFIGAVTLSRDAVQVLAEAAGTSDPAARQALVTEALRLRQRSEHISQAARASVHELDGEPGEVNRLPDDLPGFEGP